MFFTGGSELRNKNGLTEKEFLARYDDSKYKKPSVTVDMLIFTVCKGQKSSYRRLPERVLKILMVKRGNHPYIGQWALPGGFVNIDEGIRDAALRELKEEVNIDDIYMEQLYTWGDVNRDPRTRVISCSYMSLADSSKLDIKAGDDAADAGWFTVKYNTVEEKKTAAKKGYRIQDLISLELIGDNTKLSATVRTVKDVEGSVKGCSREVVSSSGIAFDHAKIIQYAIERLRNKIEYTDIAFNLMPEYFTLTELQQVYEVILGRELLKANFRRKISGMVIETDRITKDVGHRPSKLYKFNPNWVESSF
ncbi:MAG TPA: ADP-ribose pyrophosphatase [Clostridiaceae bacterium]|nr:ADP-ribose pyrophosphatase [Clostridiaceae bacterium]